MGSLLLGFYADAQEIVADTSRKEKTTVAFNEKGLQFRKGMIS